MAVFDLYQLQQGRARRVPEQDELRLSRLCLLFVAILVEQAALAADADTRALAS